MLSVRVFGGLDVEGDGAVLPRSRRARGLLAWLACHPGMHARSKVAATFWPDVLDESARASLRTALTELRRALAGAGDHLIATREHLGLGEDGLTVDLRDFDSLLGDGRREEALALAAAGEPLAGLEDEWVHELRERVLRERTSLLQALAGEAEQRGDLGEAVRLARERETLDPLSEDSGRDVIRLLAAAGDRGAALSAYDALAKRMRERLGVAPSAATRAVADQARATAEEPAAIHPAAEASRLPLPRALERTEASPFVGRDADFMRVHELWSAAASGQGLRTALVAGEAGIGKSRLAAEVARAAYGDGANVLLGRCDEEPLAPYQPFAEALRHAVRAGAGVAAKDLSAILPELGSAASEPASADPVAARARLFGAIADSMAGITGERPLLVILDDLHWADRPTLLLLAHLTRFPPTNRLMLLATYRDTDVAPGSPLASWLESERRAGGIEQIALSGLDEPAVEALVASWLGEPTQDMAHRLHERTAGNALFVEEVLKSASSDAGDETVPAGVRQAISARVGRLSDPALQIVRAVAVAGRGTDVATVAAVTGLSRDEVVEGADELLGARILRESDERRALEFTHALLRDTVYESLTGPRRAHLHAAVADALEAADTDVHLEEIANHLFQAVGSADLERTLEFLERAAERALESLAYEDAVDHAHRALELTGDADDERTARLRLISAEGQLRAGTGEVSKVAFRSAADAARAVGRSDLLARAALGYGGLGVTIIDVDEPTVALLEEAVTAVGSSEPALRARLQARLAVELYYAPQRERSESLSEEAVSLARKANDDRALAYALNARRVALWRPDRLDERIAAADEMLEVAHRAGDRVAELQARNWRVTDLFEVPDLDAWHAEVDAHTSLADELRLPAYRWYSAAWKALIALLDARFGDAHALIEQAREEGDLAGDRNAALFADMGEGGEALIRGEVETSDISFVERKLEESPAAMAYRSSYAWYLAARGEQSAAREHLGIVARDGFADLPFDANWMSAIPEAAEAAWILGDGTHAPALYDMLAPYAGRNITAGRAFACYGVAERPLGMLASLAGRPDDAIPLLETAVERNEALAFRAYAVQSRASLGEVLLAAGQPERGRRELQRALEDARALGLHGVERRVAAALGR